MATYDPAEGTFGSVCRVMSGFTDAFYRENTLRYMGRLFGADDGAIEGADDADGGGGGDEEDDGDGDEDGDGDGDAGASGGSGSEDGGGGSGRGLRLAHAAEGVETGERVSYWFAPTEVWEIRGADIT
eukprot:2045948-Prymnesium_polylepis.1